MVLQNNTSRLPEPTRLRDVNLVNYINDLIKTLRLRLDSIFNDLDQLETDVDLLQVSNTFQSFSGTTTVTADTSIGIYLIDSTVGAVTVDLPPAADAVGIIYTVKRTVTVNAITIDPDGAETIDNDPNLTLSGAGNEKCVRFLSDGTSWWTIGEIFP